MTTALKPSVQKRMQKCLDQLDLPLTVAWTPDPDNHRHGLIELSSRTLFLFDENEDEAWQTLIHEALEWKLKDVTAVYRKTVNGLLEILEQLAYDRKETFLESVPGVVAAIMREKGESEQG